MTSTTNSATLPEQPRPGRAQRRREQTHSRLVAAARVLIADKGVDATTIQEITDQADVGFGTFYNHFESKEAVLDEVIENLIADFLARLDALTADVEDPAIAIGTVVLNLARLVDIDPILCGLAVQLTMRRPELGNAVASRMREYLEHGIESDRFDLPDVRSALVAIGGVIYLSMQLRLADRLAGDAERHQVELVLRMLGVSAIEAHTIAEGPLPELPSAIP